MGSVVGCAAWGADTGTVELEDVHRLFDNVPRYTEAIMGALGSDGSVDRAAYEPVVVEIGAAGETGLVLVTWARLLAWSYAPDERPFDQALRPRRPRAVEVGRSGIVSSGERER
jgi:hypothetical protein